MEMKFCTGCSSRMWRFLYNLCDKSGRNVRTNQEK